MSAAPIESPREPTPAPQEASAQPISATKPVEEKRLGTKSFRNWLASQGLFELLEHHLETYPPSDRPTALSLMRDVKLAIYHDATRSNEERSAAIDKANRLLEELIAINPDDPQRFDRAFTLAHSLLYDQAEPYYTRILMRGNNEQDRTALLAYSTRAIKRIAELVAQLTIEFERLDLITVRQYDRLEREGYVEMLDRVAPRAQYLHLWALFYDAIARRAADSTRAAHLHEIVALLADTPRILKTPHKQSRVQVQALLLIGMTHRRLNEHVTAREYLQRAIAVAEDLDDKAERQRIEWAVRLAWIELVRSDRDQLHFDDALKGLRRFRRSADQHEAGNFGLELVMAILERSVHRAQANHFKQNGRRTSSARSREQAWLTMVRLVRKKPAHRDEVYATVYDMIEANTDTARLDPFEQCAMVSGLLVDAKEVGANAAALLDRAVAVGDRFLEAGHDNTEMLTATVCYNVGVALYHRGRVTEAAKRFLQVGRKHPNADNALGATTYAVQLAADLYANPSLREHPEVQQLYLSALEVLTDSYDGTDEAAYYRFYFGKLLDDLGQFDRAAAAYERVDPEHEHHMESRFFRLRCLQRSLLALCRQETTDPLNIQQRTRTLFDLERRVTESLAAASAAESDDDRRTYLLSLAAETPLLRAEVELSRAVERPAQALESLAFFETEHRGNRALSSRVWRVRLLAYEKLGRLAEAARTIPVYVEADPAGSGPTLQALYVDLTTSLDPFEETRPNSDARRKADVALLLAEQIRAWSDKHHAAASRTDRRAVTIQLAEANLRAGNAEDARALLGSLIDERTAAEPRVTADLRIVVSLAESLYRLDEFARALPLFNRAATELESHEPLRWRALLRDLQCRTSLGESPANIIQVIEQQRTLHDNLRSVELSEAFNKLLRENQRRMGDG